MKKKTWIAVLGIILVIVIAVVVVININSNKDKNNEINMEVKRDESVNIDGLKDTFDKNVENIKDSINKTE